MKKKIKIFTLLLITLCTFSSQSVNAKESYYTNSYGVQLTQEEYKEFKHSGILYGEFESKEIIVNDLSNLDIERIDKNYLVNLFNRTISSSLKNEAGDYINASSLNKKTLESTDENMPGHWQIMYLLDYGNIEKVNIEFIDENGTYILDIKDTTQENKELYNKIETIENQIIKNQSMSIPQTRSNTNTINQDLINLLDSAQEEISQ